MRCHIQAGASPLSVDKRMKAIHERHDIDRLRREFGGQGPWISSPMSIDERMVLNIIHERGVQTLEEVGVFALQLFVEQLVGASIGMS